MTIVSQSLAVSISLFVGMIACSEVGRWFAHRRVSVDPDGAWHGIGVIDGAIFGLLGLLVAFSFYGASSRFDARRDMIVQEANAIGTAYLRLDLLPKESQPDLREKFRQYLDARIEVYESFPDFSRVRTQLEICKSLESAIWAQSWSAAASSEPATMLLLPAINEMFDIANTRVLSLMMHPPAIVYVMLVGSALFSAILVGYGMARSRSRNWFHIIGYAAVTAGMLYVIIDIEHPRLGAIQIGSSDLALQNLRKSWSI